MYKHKKINKRKTRSLKENWTKYKDKINNIMITISVTLNSINILRMKEI